VYRIGAKELYVDAGRVEITEACADDVVVNVTFELDNEAVVAKSLASRPRFDSRQVDRTPCERAQNLIQTAWPVTALEACDRSAIATGRGGDAVPCHEEKSRLVALMVLDRVCEDVESIDRCRERRCNCGGVQALEGVVAEETRTISS